MMLLSFTLTANAQKPTEDVTIATGQYSADWSSLNGWECPEWFKDAKFGIWAHWGPQCAAEDGDWYARFMYYSTSGQYTWHMNHFGDPEEYGLKELIRDWKAEEWNPEQLVELYKSVGARYFMTLGQHHDNFDLWNSPYQEWNSVNLGPKRDIVGEWAEACKKNGLKLGVSMHGSHAWTWLEPSQEYDGNLTKSDGAGKWWEGYDPQELYAQRHEHSSGWDNSGTIHSQWDWGNGASLPSAEYKQKFQNRVLQCINDYDPDVLYFDDTVLPFYGCDDQIGLNILQHYYNTSAAKNGGQAQVVATGKILKDSHKKAMMWDVERGVPDRPQDEYWQTCTCIGSWHYDINVYNNNGYKSAQQVVDMLVDIVSKNGNLLLSVPVRGNGSIDDKEMAILRDIKAWMDVNSSSIYGTRPWKTFGEGPLADAVNPISAQGFNESNNYTSDDVRYVQRNDTLFATIMRWPAAGKFTFGRLGITSEFYSGKAKSVKLLGKGDVDFSNDIDGLTVTVPSDKPNPIAPVFAITFDEESIDDVSTNELIKLYEQKVNEFRMQANYNTGKYNRDKVNEFAAKVMDAKAQIEAGTADEDQLMKELSDAFNDMKENGKNEGGEPKNDPSSDVTIEHLVESNNFSASIIGSRFGTPDNWTVEDFDLPELDASKGNKNGIDNYPGYNCLMLGLWNGEDGAPTNPMTNARIYRTVHLEPGRYYFGASYHANYNLSSQAYIFAANTTLDTGDIPEKSIAYDQINKAGTSSKYRGIFFTLSEEQDVALGFQADLSNGNSQEFRVDHVVLLDYGQMNFDAIDELIMTVDNTLGDAKVNDNTGYFSKQACEKLQEALKEAMEITEDSSEDEINNAYNKLSAAYQDFLTNGKNPGGLPSDIKNEDLTIEKLIEADNFSRLDPGVTTRFATPANWTVENFMIPNGGDGTKNGIDHYPGYDCLYLGLWNDRDNNTEGDLSNARIYRTIHLEAGRYYFGGAFQTTYNINDKAYLFVADGLINTAKIEEESIAYYPINNAAEGDNLYGLFFTLQEAQDVVIGFQADLNNGSDTQEFRCKGVKLLYYGEINAKKVAELIEEIEENLATVKINDNTGFYSQAAVDELMAVVTPAKEITASSDYEEVSDTYYALIDANSKFFEDGKNQGGEPTGKEGADYRDITEEKLHESGPFKRTEDTANAGRFGAPEYWTVENFGFGDQAGIDNISGTDCLHLEVWWNNTAFADNGYDITNVRLYQKVTLPEGKYYFGATYPSAESNEDAYIFASEEILNTNDISTFSIAYEKVNKAGANGPFRGLFFTLDKETEVYLGFQADFSKVSTNNIRCQAIKLLSYSMMKGDVNEDGKVDINDVVAIINVMAGTANWANANVNEDAEGSVDINDVVAVINIMAGL